MEPEGGGCRLAKLVTLIINVEDTRLSVALSTPQSLVVAKPNLSWQILYLVPPAVCFVSFQPVFPNQGHKGIQAMGRKGHAQEMNST